MIILNNEFDYVGDELNICPPLFTPHDIFLATGCSGLTSEGIIRSSSFTSMRLTSKGKEQEAYRDRLMAFSLMVDEATDEHGFFGVVAVREFGVGLFQTKINWYDIPNLDVIARSAAMLSEEALENEDITYHLPTIGQGVRFVIQLGDVFPLLRGLPDNVAMHDTGHVGSYLEV